MNGEVRARRAGELRSLEQWEAQHLTAAHIAALVRQLCASNCVVLLVLVVAGGDTDGDAAVSVHNVHCF